MPDSTLDALKFLQRPPESTGPLVAVFGPDAYLKREVLRGIRRALARGGEEPAEHRLEGREATLAGVLDELSTVSLFGDEARLVILEDADPFVTEHRAALERYVERPAKSGVLVLEVKSWPSTTKLAKATAAAGGLAIRCDPPKPAQLRTWLTRRAKGLGVTLPEDALALLLDLLPPELGLLEQELERIASVVGQGGEITAAAVQQNVGGGRVRQTWDMIDAAAMGNAADALAQLDRLITAGEDPAGLLPQMAGVLRRFVIAGRIIESTERNGRRANLRTALQQAGIPPFKIGESERQLRQLGRARIDRLLSWLLEADLALKGSHSRGHAARRVIERLIVRLSKLADRRQM